MCRFVSQIRIFLYVRVCCNLIQVCFLKCCLSLEKPGLLTLTSYSLHVFSKMNTFYYSILVLNLYTILDVVFQPAIDGLSVLVPAAAMPGSQLLFSHPSGPTRHGCACSPGNDTPPGLAGLFLLFPAANLWDVGILPLPDENVAGGADLSSDL